MPAIKPSKILCYFLLFGLPRVRQIIRHQVKDSKLIGFCQEKAHIRSQNVVVFLFFIFKTVSVVSIGVRVIRRNWLAEPRPAIGLENLLIGMRRDNEDSAKPEETSSVTN